MKKFVVAVTFMLLFSISLLTAEKTVLPETLEDWTSLLHTNLDEVVAAAAGVEYLNIDPSEYKSHAERIIYYPEGVTFWADKAGIVQIRFDSKWRNKCRGVGIGINRTDLTKSIGEPWVSDSLSLYYNLQWKEGPVRIRFVFSDEVLNEVYLYSVR